MQNMQELLGFSSPVPAFSTTIRPVFTHTLYPFSASGLIIVKPYQNVTVRLFGTRLHELKTVRVTDNRVLCSLDTTIQQPVSADALLELSPNTATFTFKFPHHSTTYCFCFEWRRMLSAVDDGRTEGLFFHQGEHPFCCVATVRKSWLG